jgi:hypothetical protein
MPKLVRRTLAFAERAPRERPPYVATELLQLLTTFFLSLFLLLLLQTSSYKLREPFGLRAF